MKSIRYVLATLVAVFVASIMALAVCGPIVFLLALVGTWKLPALLWAAHSLRMTFDESTDEILAIDVWWFGHFVLWIYQVLFAPITLFTF